jgi:hypothetical protein
MRRAPVSYYLQTDLAGHSAFWPPHVVANSLPRGNPLLEQRPLFSSKYNSLKLLPRARLPGMEFAKIFSESRSQVLQISLWCFSRVLFF